MSLSKKSLQAVVWSFIDSFGVYFVRFGFTIAIARQLTPRDYGLIGMVGIFIALATLIAEGGFSMALIQKKNTTNTDYSTIFFFNLISATFLYLILFFSAEIISSFYKEPTLTNIIKVTGIGIILSSLLTIHVTILGKSLNFKHQAVINAVSAFSSGVTGLILAYNGYGVWALVYQTLVGSTIAVILYWMKNKWHPIFTFSLSSFLGMYKYSVNIFFQGFSSLILDGIYYPIIGKLYNATELGFFANADRFYQIFVRRITISYGRVAFPAFVQLQGNPESFGAAYRKTSLVLGFILIPLTILLIISSKPLILILLTEKWANSIPLLQLLYLDGFFFPFLLLNQNVLNALGKSSLSLKIDLFKKCALIIGILLTFHLGIKILILCQVGSTLAGLLLSTLIVKKYINLDLLLYNFLPIFLMSAILLAICYGISRFQISSVLTLSLDVSMVLIYFISSKFLNIKGYHELISFINPMIPLNLKKYL